MQKFLDNVTNNAEASAILLNWGLRLAKGTVRWVGTCELFMFCRYQSQYNISCY